MGILRRLGILRDRRASARTPVLVDAQLELDAVDLHGAARDLGDGGVFFETTEPLAPGLHGTLIRGGEPVNVRVTWRRAGREPGVGLAFEPQYIRIRRMA